MTNVGRRGLACTRQDYDDDGASQTFLHTTATHAHTLYNTYNACNVQWCIIDCIHIIVHIRYNILCIICGSIFVYCGQITEIYIPNRVNIYVSCGRVKTDEDWWIFCYQQSTFNCQPIVIDQRLGVHCIMYKRYRCIGITRQHIIRAPVLIAKSKGLQTYKIVCKLL